MKLGAITLSLFFLLPTFAFATTRNSLHQQGLVVDLDGNPVEGLHEMTFRFYESATGGDPVWEETVGINFSGGFYSADLGEARGLPDELFQDAEDLYLGLILDWGEEFSPRFAIGSVPFSRVAEVAVTALSVDDAISLPRLVISGYGEVIDENGEWIGPPIGSSEIANQTIVDADVSGSAAIAWSKISKSGALPQDVGAAASVHTHLPGDVGAAAAAHTHPASNITGELADSQVSDSLTIGSGGSVADAALSSNVTRLGSSVESSEIADGGIVNLDISPTAAIAGAKIAPDFGTQGITTSGNIVTTGSGNITAAGDLAAAGGFKMMIGPFSEKDVAANTTKSWDSPSENLGRESLAMPWAGSVMGISANCSAAVTGGSLTVRATIDGIATTLNAVMSAGNASAYASTAKDAEAFGAGAALGCQGSTTALSPGSLLDCNCVVFVEM